MKVTRRDFMKLCGVSAVMLGMGAKIAPPSLAAGTDAAPIAPREPVGMLIDTTRCIGCRLCQLACQKRAGLPQDTKPIQLSTKALTVIQMVNPSDTNSKKLLPIKRQCFNCNNPSCVAACTVGALQKLPNGPVVYDKSRCIGCRYCMYACPFGVPTFEWDKQFSLISKCDGCADRLAQGQVQACVEACPVKALTNGTRNDLLTIANQRIYDGKDAYVKHLYGENEIGGTTMLYLASVPFEQLGFPNIPHEAPAETNALIMHSTPTVATMMMLVLSGIYGLVKRLKESPLPNEVNQTITGGH